MAPKPTSKAAKRRKWKRGLMIAAMVAVPLVATAPVLINGLKSMPSLSEIKAGRDKYERVQQRSAERKKQKAAAANQPEPPRCPTNDCKAFDVPFKSGLAFGMTMDEAIAAMPALNKAHRRDGRKVYARGAASLEKLHVALPGKVLVLRTKTAGETSICTFEFAVGHKLSAIVCTVDGLPRTLFNDAENRISALLERRYGKETDSTGGMEMTNIEINDRFFRTWASDAGQLELEQVYVQQGSTLVTSVIRISQMVPEHATLIENARAKSRALFEKRRSKRTAQPL